jgi:hypothetical protein
MRRRLREAVVTVGAGICLGGPIAAIALPLSPATWRQPPLVWGILAVSVALVAMLRRRHA